MNIFEAYLIEKIIRVHGDIVHQKPVGRDIPSIIENTRYKEVRWIVTENSWYVWDAGMNALHSTILMYLHFDQQPFDNVQGTGSPLGLEATWIRSEFENWNEAASLHPNPWTAMRDINARAFREFQKSGLEMY